MSGCSGAMPAFQKHAGQEFLSASVVSSNRGCLCVWNASQTADTRSEVSGTPAAQNGHVGSVRLLFAALSNANFERKFKTQIYNAIFKCDFQRDF